MPNRLTYSKIAANIDLFTKYLKKLLPNTYVLIHPISWGKAISSIYNKRLPERGVMWQDNSSNTRFL